jgi:hypothetical protein
MPLASGCARGLEFEVMAVDACSEAELQRRVDKPNFPELVSGPERPRSLASSASACTSSPAHPGFPEPLYRLGVGSLWIRQSIETFAQHWERRPGRPRKLREPEDDLATGPTDARLLQFLLRTGPQPVRFGGLCGGSNSSGGRI